MLTSKDLREVQNALWTIREKWYNIGLQLGLEESALNVIRGNHDNIDDRFTAMLSLWLHQEKPTWAALVSALNSAPVDCKDTAAAVEKKFIPTEEQNREEDVDSDTLDELLENPPRTVMWTMEELDRDFSRLVLKTRDALKRRKRFTVQFLRSQFDTFPSSRRHEHQEFFDKYVFGSNRLTVDDLWSQLCSYWHFINYQLLKFVIDRSDCNSLIADMEQYESEIKLFCEETSLHDFVKCFPILYRRGMKSANKHKLKVTVVDKSNKLKLVHLNRLERDFVTTFSLPKMCGLILKRIVPGSFVITWLVSAHYLKLLRWKLSICDEKFFESHDIQSVSLDGEVCYLKGSERSPINPAQEVASNTTITEEVFELRNMMERVMMSSPPFTMTQLCTAYVCKMLTQHFSRHPVYSKQHLEIHRFSDLPPEIQGKFYYLCQLAYQGIMKRSSFTPQTGVDDLGFMISKGTHQQFIHRTVQEFLAAVHITSTTTEGVLRNFPAFELQSSFLPYFVAGLLTKWTHAFPQNEIMKHCSKNIFVFEANSAKVTASFTASREMDKVYTLGYYTRILFVRPSESASFSPIPTSFKERPSPTPDLTSPLTLSVSKHPTETSRAADLYDQKEPTEEMFKSIAIQSHRPRRRWLPKFLHKRVKSTSKPKDELPAPSTFVPSKSVPSTSVPSTSVPSTSAPSTSLILDPEMSILCELETYSSTSLEPVIMRSELEFEPEQEIVQAKVIAGFVFGCTLFYGTGLWKLNHYDEISIEHVTKGLVVASESTCKYGELTFPHEDLKISIDIMCNTPDLVYFIQMPYSISNRIQKLKFIKSYSPDYNTVHTDLQLTEGSEYVATILEQSKVLDELAIHTKFIDQDYSTFLTPILSGLHKSTSLKVLTILHDLTFDQVVTLSSYLKKDSSKLNELILERCDIEAKGVGELASALQVNVLLRRFKFSRGVGVHLIARSLQDNKTLKTLDLSYANLMNEGASELGKMLSVNQSLENLHLCSTKITHVVLTALVEGLRTNTTLKELDLRQSRSIEDEGAREISIILSANQSLETLRLSNAEITWKGASALADGLMANKALKKLDLSGNSVGDAGASALARALKGNQTLLTLDLSHNNIHDDGVHALAEMLVVNKSLKELNIYSYSSSGFNTTSSSTVSHIIDCLRQNTTLEKLTIRVSDNLKQYKEARLKY